MTSSPPLATIHQSGSRRVYTFRCALGCVAPVLSVEASNGGAAVDEARRSGWAFLPASVGSRCGDGVRCPACARGLL